MTSSAGSAGSGLVGLLSFDCVDPLQLALFEAMRAPEAGAPSGPRVPVGAQTLASRLVPVLHARREPPRAADQVPYACSRAADVLPRSDSAEEERVVLALVSHIYLPD